ncbi:MAG: hypothetical protein H8D82_01130 [Euryarchaeota archaeon]|nr:hypothetical protein [Euryarchaeota archaeon]
MKTGLGRAIAMLLVGLMTFSSVTTVAASYNDDNAWEYETSCSNSSQLVVRWNDDILDDSTYLTGVIETCGYLPPTNDWSLRYDLYIGPNLIFSNNIGPNSYTTNFITSGTFPATYYASVIAVATSVKEYSSIEEAWADSGSSTITPGNSGPINVVGGTSNCPPHQKLSGIRYDYDQFTSPASISSAGSFSNSGSFSSFTCVLGPLYVVELDWLDYRDTYFVDPTDRCEIHYHQRWLNDSPNRINPDFSNIVYNLSQHPLVYSSPSNQAYNCTTIGVSNMMNVVAGKLNPFTTTTVGVYQPLSPFVGNPSEWMNISAKSLLIREDAGGNVSMSISTVTRAAYRDGNYALYTKDGQSCSSGSNCGSIKDLDTLATQFDYHQFTADYSGFMSTTVSTPTHGSQGGASQNPSPSDFRVYLGHPQNIQAWGLVGAIPISDIDVLVEIKDNNLQCISPSELRWQVELTITFEEITSGSGSFWTWTDTTDGWGVGTYHRSISLDGGPQTQGDASVWVMKDIEIIANEHGEVQDLLGNWILTNKCDDQSSPRPNQKWVMVDSGQAADYTITLY